MQSSASVLKTTIPKEFLKAPDGFNPNVIMFISAILLITISTCGYFFVGMG